MRRRVCGTLVIFVLTQSTFGAERVDVGTVLSIDAARGTITDTKRKEDTALLAVNRFTIRRNETVKIEILQNTLLFTYETKSSKADTAEYAAALEFAKQLQALLALFPASKASDIERAAIGGFDPDQFRKDLAKVLEFHSKLGTHLAASISGPEQVAQLKKDYAAADFEAISKRLDDGYLELTRILIACGTPNAVLTTNRGEQVRCDGSSNLDLNIGLTKVVTTRNTVAAQMDELETQGRAGEGALALAKANLVKAEAALATAPKADKAKAAEAVAKLRDDISGLDKDLTGIKFTWDRLKAQRDPLDKQIRTAEAEIASVAPLASFARDMSATQGKMSALVTLLVAFAGDVASIGKPFPLATVPHSIQQDTETIEVKASGKYDSFLDSGTRKRRDGMLKKFDVVLEPYHPAHLSLAPAFVLGFIKNPEFTAVKDGDAFKIERKEEEVNRYTAAVMLNITPDSWQEPTFGGHFQLGISPVKDSLGFFVGAGIKAQKLFSLGAGLMLQQVRKLGPGLTMESRLDDPAKLKTAREFKRGLYLHVTVEIPK